MRLFSALIVVLLLGAFGPIQHSGGVGTAPPIPPVTGFTEVQAISAACGGATSASSVTCVFPGNTTAGNLLIIDSNWQGGGAISSVTHNSDTCSQVPNVATNNSGTGTEHLIDMWYCPNIAGTSPTVVVNYSTSVGFPGVRGAEFSGAKTSSVVDNGNSGFGYGFTPNSAPTYSMSAFYAPTPGNTSQSGDLIYSVMYPDAAASTITAGNSGLPQAVGASSEYQIATSVGPYMNTWTTASQPADSVIIGVAAFKASAGVPATITNTVTAGAASLPCASGSPSGYECAAENYEAWLSYPTYGSYTIQYTPYCFNSQAGGNCIDQTGNYNFAYSNSRTKTVWSVALTGCDTYQHLTNPSQSLTACPTANTIPLSGGNSIASGYEDSIYNAMFAAIQAKTPHAIIRIGWEMNFNYAVAGWPWGVGGPGGSTLSNTAYILAFQHLANKAHTYGFLVDWCPNITATQGPADYFYPGDAYVDMIGMDFYDLSGLTYVGYEQTLYGLYWHAAFAKLHNKSMAYDEWGCGLPVASGGGGDSNCEGIIAGMATRMASLPVDHFDFWNIDDDGSVVICGADPNHGGAAGNCSGTSLAPTSQTEFLSVFQQ